MIMMMIWGIHDDDDDRGIHEPLSVAYSLGSAEVELSWCRREH